MICRMKQDPYLNVFFKKLDPAAVIPSYATYGDAGADLCSIESLSVLGGRTVPVRTGLALAIPYGFAGFLLPRSGNAKKYSVTLANSPGLLDAGYRGEVVCLVQNHGLDPFVIAAGDRIAQLVVQRVTNCHFVEATELSASARDTGGFGSTGR